ncbi:tricarboxylate transport mitochondrial [Nannochloropsis oceanica]
MAPIGNKPTHKGKAVLAGGLSGAFEICCTFPTEYVKTTQQLSSKSMSVKQVISNTMAESGVLGFYRGLSSMLYFAAPKAAIRFSAFEFFSSCLTDADGGDKFGLGQAKGFLAGLGAGTMEAIFVTTPQETIKIKLIHDQFRGTNKYNGFFHGVKTIVADEKISGVYRGLLPTIMKVSTAQATRFGIFTVIKDYVKLDTPIKSAAAGATAGGISVLAFQGIDVVKSRMQGLEAAKYTSTLDCVGQIMKNEGIAGFYKGVGPRLTRVCLEVGITMSLYGEIVKFLDSIWDTTPKVPMPH